MSLAFRRLGLVAVLAGLGGCGGEPFSPGDTGSGAGGQGAGATATAGGGAMTGTGGSCAGVCAPDVDGWDGPVAWKPSADAAICPGAWTKAKEAFVGPITGKTECIPCACGRASGVECSMPKVTMYDADGCAAVDEVGSLIATPDGCDPFPTSVYALKSDPSVPSGGSCEHTGGDATLDPPQWAGRGVLCQPPATTPCAGGQCMPDPPGGLSAEACVYHDGEIECPPAYPLRKVLFRDFVDTRACTACTCSTPSGASCVDNLIAYYSGTCSVSTLPIPADGVCHTADGVSALSMSSAAVGGSCGASTSVPTGSLDGAKPLTICCAQ